MNRKLFVLTLIAISMFVVNAQVGSALLQAPSVHNINTDAMYYSIQEAINDASPGDEIHVYSSTYYENVNVSKQLTLRGIDTGFGMPVVDASGSGSAITLSVDGITLGGFTTTNTGDWPNRGDGIKVISSNNTISGNNASYNPSYAIHLHSSSNNTISNNNVSNNGHGIYLGDSSNNNNITSNNAFNNGVGIRLIYGPSNNTISNNNASNNRVGISIRDGSNSLAPKLFF